jgi:hypothetical protein
MEQKISESSPQKRITGRGGARPGAGRKVGSVGDRVKMIRAVAEGALKPGKTPLDVMLKNMRYYDEKAEAAMRWIEQKLGNPKSQPKEVLALLKELSEYRMQAQKCACEAAPYVHPKLASIEHIKTDNRIKAKQESDMTDEELDEYYNKLRTRPTTHVPLIIDNDTGDTMIENENVATY